MWKRRWCASSGWCDACTRRWWLWPPGFHDGPGPSLTMSVRCNNESIHSSGKMITSTRQLCPRGGHEPGPRQPGRAERFYRGTGPGASHPRRLAGLPQGGTPAGPPHSRHRLEHRRAGGLQGEPGRPGSPRQAGCLPGPCPQCGSVQDACPHRRSDAGAACARV